MTRVNKPPALFPLYRLMRANYPLIIPLRQLFLTALLLLFTFTINMAGAESSHTDSALTDNLSLNKRTVAIGILAPEGEKSAKENWGGWIDDLNGAFPQYHFVMQPLTLRQLERAAADNELDLILTHQLSFLALTPDTSLRWVATLNSNPHNFNPTTEIGSAIWVKSESNIHEFTDLQQKEIAAIAPTAFGGFLLGYKALVDAGLKAPQQITLIFTGYPIDTSLMALQKGEVDAAIAPSCLFESMTHEGLINPDHFRLISGSKSGENLPTKTPITNHPQNNDSIHCYSSTPLFHNWSLAATPTLPDDLALTLQQHLLFENNPDLPSWILPVSLSKTNELLKLSGLLQVDESLWQTILRLALTYKLWLLAIILIMLMLLINHLWLSYAARTRRQELETIYHTLREYEEMLARADRFYILGEVASGIAHELNQPLMAIRNYAEGTRYAIQKGSDPIRYIAPLEKIDQQVEQCTSIIKNLQSWAKPKEVERREWIDLYPVLLRLIELTQLQHKNRIKIEIKMQCERKLFSVVSILEQVITNSLLNSIQAGADEILIETQCHQTYYKILIIDNGMGFDQKELEAPFVPFRTRKKEGLGLGLVICERLIASLSGKFKIDNRRDGTRGASVRIILPNGES